MSLAQAATRLEKLETKLNKKTEPPVLTISAEGREVAERIAGMFNLPVDRCIYAQAEKEMLESYMASKGAMSHAGARLEDRYWKAAKSFTITGDVEVIIKRVIKVLTYSVLVEAHGALMLIPKHSIIYAEISEAKLNDPDDDE